MGATSVRHGLGIEVDFLSPPPPPIVDFNLVFIPRVGRHHRFARPSTVQCYTRCSISSGSSHHGRIHPARAAAAAAPARRKSPRAAPLDRVNYVAAPARGRAAERARQKGGYAGSDGRVVAVCPAVVGAAYVGDDFVFVRLLTDHPRAHARTYAIGEEREEVVGCCCCCC